jgi:hypothetical protein
VPADETSFYTTLQRVTQHRNLRGLNAEAGVIDALASGAIDQAVQRLSARAAAGDKPANVALVRIQNWCGRIMSARADPQAQIAKFGNELPAERASRAAGVLLAEAQFFNRAREGCGRAPFDYDGIEARLREAAAAADPLSATNLAQFTRDPRKREALLQAAVDKQFVPAMYALATDRLMAVQRGETTENVASIRLLLKQAGRVLPRAKLDLANCMALGCDGHPADAATAAEFGMDAARDGEPTAYLSMVRMPWGARRSRVELLAWQYFGDRLNEAGCGGDAYVMSALTLTPAIRQLEKGQDAKLLDQAKSQADDLWRDNSARAMREQECK